MRHVAQSNLRKLKINRLNFVIPLMAMGGLGAIGILAINQDADYDASALSEEVNANLSYGQYYLSLTKAQDSIDMNVEAMAGGTYAYANDTLTAKTNAPTYRLYISSNDTSTADLTRIGGSETISVTSGTSASPAALALNRYGYAVPSGESGNDGFDASYTSIVDSKAKWAGLPVKSASTMDLIRSGTATGTKTDAGEETHVYYAVRADNSLVAGTYAGQVLYTMVADIPTQAISIDPATGTANQTQSVVVESGPIIAAGTALTTSQVSITIGGSACTIASDSAIVTTDGYLKTTCTAPALAAGTYDVVVEVSDYGYSDTLTQGYTVEAPATLQTFTTDKCSALTQWKSDGTTGDTATIQDSRDQNEYQVRHLADNHCWMVTNLKLGKTSKMTLYKTDTDITADSWDLPASSGGSGNPSWSNDSTTAYMHIGTTSDSNWTSTYGNYYNWPAAVAGNTTNSGDATTSICPKGWKLPKGDTSEYSWYYLYNTGYNSDQNKFRTATNTGSGYWSGIYYSGSLNGAGSYGYWWSRSAYNGNVAYRLDTNSSYVNPQNYDNKYNGNSVRCVFVGS